jgi:hypothetical protein
MAIRTIFASVVALWLTMWSVQAQQRASFIMGRGYVGALKVGMRGDEVVALFGKQRVREFDLYTENPEPERALEVRLGDVNAAMPSLVVRLTPATPGPIVLSQKRVRGIEVHDARFRTADGLGIGSTLREISARHGAKVSDGEGSVGAVAQDLGMTFDFTMSERDGHIPPTARAESVWVWGTVAQAR